MDHHISDISMYKTPGLAPMISFAGTRLSEQPIHNNGGVCPWLNLQNNLDLQLMHFQPTLYYFLIFFIKSLIFSFLSFKFITNSIIY
jgi:hypothetical protein